MLAPGACFLCELSPNEGEPVFDTARNFNPPAPSPLDGRKYVCRGCGVFVAEAFGFVAAEVAVVNAERAADADARVAAVLDQVASVVGDLSPAALQAAADGHPRFVAAVARSNEELVAEVPGIVPELELPVAGVSELDELGVVIPVDEDEDVSDA